MVKVPIPTTPPPPERLFVYRAIVTSVHDGDTCTINIDLGMGVWKHGETLRFARINAPEIHGETKAAGLETTAMVKRLIEGQEIIIQTIKD